MQSSQPILFASFFFCLRGGVTGRPIFAPEYGYFAFFSAGLRIYGTPISLNRARRDTRTAYLERAQEGLVDTHHGTRVVELATVVRRREESHQVSFGEKFVPVLDNLSYEQGSQNRPLARSGAR